MAIITRSVAAGADDAQEDNDGTDFNGTGAQLFNQSSSNPASERSTAIRFQNIQIPKNALILAATVTVDVVPSIGDDEPEFRIHCHDVDNSPDFVTSADVASRTLTSAFTHWSGTNIGSGLKTSPDFKAAVQEVINRAGWVAGNALTVIFRAGDFALLDQFQYYAFEHATGTPASISISFQSGGSGGGGQGNSGGGRGGGTGKPPGTPGNGPGGIGGFDRILVGSKKRRRLSTL